MLSRSELQSQSETRQLPLAMFSLSIFSQDNFQISPSVSPTPECVLAVESAFAFFCFDSLESFIVCSWSLARSQRLALLPCRGVEKPKRHSGESEVLVYAVLDLCVPWLRSVGGRQDRWDDDGFRVSAERGLKKLRYVWRLGLEGYMVVLSGQAVDARLGISAALAMSLDDFYGSLSETS